MDKVADIFVEDFKQDDGPYTLPQFEADYTTLGERAADAFEAEPYNVAWPHIGWGGVLPDGPIF